MTQLVFIQNNQPVTDSLTIAEVFGKRHDNVVNDITNQLEKLKLAKESEWGSLNFQETQYQHPQNRQWYTKFDLTEDAFTLVAMSYVTPEAMKMKVRFIQEFKKMREYIQNKITPLSKDQALVTVLRTTADLVESHDEIVKEQHEMRKLITQIDNKVEEQITLDHGEQRRLQKGIASKVYELCDDPKERPRLFKEIYREIKDRFGVASYKDVKRKELQSAIRYVENWIPKKVS